MSSAVYPTLASLGFDVLVEPYFKTLIQESASGKELRVSSWSAPRRKYTLTYEFLRDDVTNNELRKLISFFNARGGSLDSFLFVDPDDNTVAAQQIGIGDNVTTVFQLVRTFGAAGYVEPVSAPNVVSHVYQNGVDTGGWSVDSTTGLVTFTTAPPNLVVLTADFTFYWRCRFLNDTQQVNKFAAGLWGAKKVEFVTIK